MVGCRRRSCRRVYVFAVGSPDFHGRAFTVYSEVRLGFSWRGRGGCAPSRVTCRGRGIIQSAWLPKRWQMRRALWGTVGVLLGATAGWVLPYTFIPDPQDHFAPIAFLGWRMLLVPFGAILGLVLGLFVGKRPPPS